MTTSNISGHYENSKLKALFKVLPVLHLILTATHKELLHFAD